jgi:SAM-dependent methyltransferase
MQFRIANHRKVETVTQIGDVLVERALHDGLAQYLFRPAAMVALELADRRTDFAPKRMLDAGSGSGVATVLAIERYAPTLTEVVLLDRLQSALDVAEEVLDEAKRSDKMKHVSARTELQDLTKPFQFQHSGFDTLIVAHVLENLAPDERRRALGQIVATLEPQGFGLFTFWAETTSVFEQIYECTNRGRGTRPELSHRRMGLSQITELFDGYSFEIVDDASFNIDKRSASDVVTSWLDGSYWGRKTTVEQRSTILGRAQNQLPFGGKCEQLLAIVRT